MNERINNVVFSTIDEINKQLKKEQRLGKKPSTVLIGESGKLDSLGQVNFIVTLEENIETEFDMTIALTDELFMSESNNHVLTIGDVCKHLATNLHA